MDNQQFANLADQAQKAAQQAGIPQEQIDQVKGQVQGALGGGAPPNAAGQGVRATLASECCSPELCSDT
jgi:hypothetical protein